MSDVEAGPSTAPVVFKKRAARPPSAAASRRSVLARDSMHSNGQDHSEADDAHDSAKHSKTNLENGVAADQEEEATHTLDDLVRLRAMRAKATGISLERLNKGEVKKKKKGKKDDTKGTQKSAEERWAEQMQKGGLVELNDLRDPQGKRASGPADDSDDEADEEGGDKEQSKANRLASKANFTEEKATVDVDKHMMAFIEEEMKKRKSAERANGDDTLSQADKTALNKMNPAISSLDELYSISEKYKLIQKSAREAIAREKGGAAGALASAQSSADKRDDGQDREREEGNVALSTAMLTSVPEIDLGMETRIKNIEATERARRAMEAAAEAHRMARKKGGDGDEDDLDYGAARFFRHSGPVMSDNERARAQRAEQGDSGGAGDDLPQGETRRRQTATDDAARDRFKKRQRNQLK